MSQGLYLFSTLPLAKIEIVVDCFKEDFDHFLNDSFSDEDSLKFEKHIDTMAAISVQPILSELSFDDFYPDPSCESEQRAFFDRCQSSITLENMPFLDINPFQVYYLQKLLNLFDNILIDSGGVNELKFKESYLNMIKNFKSIDSILKSDSKLIEVKTLKPVDPIDFLILDVYKELERLKNIDLATDELNPKVQKILLVMKLEKLDASQLLRKVSLGAKDFDDGLERLKFWLRKIPS